MFSMHINQNAIHDPGDKCCWVYFSAKPMQESEIITKLFVVVKIEKKFFWNSKITRRGGWWRANKQLFFAPQHSSFSLKKQIAQHLGQKKKGVWLA